MNYNDSADESEHLEDVVYGPLDETDSIIRDIISRHEGGEFPEVLPEQASSDSIANGDVSDMLHWMQHTDHEKITKYMEDRYSDSINEGGSMQVSSAVARAKWARDWYYVHATKYFWLHKSGFAKATDAFMSMVRLDDLPKEAIDIARDLLMQIGDVRAEELVTFMKGEWMQFWNNLPPFLRADEIEMRQKWAASNYETLLRSFVASIDMFEFQPELSLESVEPGERRDTAAKLVARVTRTHVDTIQSEVNKAFTAETAGIPLCILDGMRNEIRQRFLEAKYFNIVSSVLDGPADARDCIKFTPAVPVDVLPDNTKPRALALLQRVLPEHSGKIDREVQSRFKQTMSTLPEFLQTKPPDSIREEWMKQNYYDIVEEVVANRTGNYNTAQSNDGAAKVVATATVDGVPPQRRTAHAAMLESPHPRHTRARGAARREDAKEPLYVTVSGIADSSSRSDAHILQAYVLYWPEEPRWVEVKDRRTQAIEQVAVVTCLMADREGPVLVDFWRELALTAIASFNNWMEGVDGNNTQDPLVVELTYFWIRAESRKVLVPMRKVVSSERTVISMLPAGTQESVSRMADMPPAEILFTRDLSTLEQEPPFVVSVVGVIGSCGEDSMSRAGRAMKFFEIHDNSGKCVQCTALGRHAENACIEDGNEVVLYFAQGTASSASNPCGQLWLYDESHILLLRRNCIVPPTRFHLDFKTRSQN